MQGGIPIIIERARLHVVGILAQIIDEIDPSRHGKVAPRIVRTLRDRYVVVSVHPAEPVEPNHERTKPPVTVHAAMNAGGLNETRRPADRRRSVLADHDAAYVDAKR